MVDITRRGFVKCMGALAGAASIGGGIPAIAAAAEKAKSPRTAGKAERYVKSTCCHCVNFCGIKVKMAGDVIEAIYPDEARAEFYNWGICPKGVSGLFNTYNPYRIKTPLKRTNPIKGVDQDPGWVEISWEEAFDAITQRMKKIRQDNPSKLIWHHGHGKYLIDDTLPKAFCAAFGTPNVIHRTTTCESSRHVADELTWGYHGFLPDLKHTNYLINLGANYYEAEQWARWLDHASTEAKERGMKVVALDPRLSVTAAKANEWVPIRPGKDVMFLLAMAKELIEAGLIDEEFLLTYTNSPNLVGDDGKILRDKEGRQLIWDTASNSARPLGEGAKPALRGDYTVDGANCRTGFQLFVDSLKDVTPAHAAEVCGVPADTIKRVAREFGMAAQIGATTVIDGVKLRYRPVAIHSFRGTAAKEYGVQNWRAALMVQMMVGCVDAVGGINLHDVYKNPKYMEPAKCEYPPKRVDLAQSVFFPNGHHDVCQQVALTVANPGEFGLPYEPEMQIFYATNRAFSTSEPGRQFDGMKKTFNVGIEIVLTETMQMCDIVLPDLTYLEAWHFAPTRWTPDSKHTAIRQPVANVYNLKYEAMSILWELARRLELRDKYIEQLNDRFKLKEYKFETGRDYSPRETVEVLWAEKTHGKPFGEAMEKGFVGKKVSTKDKYLNGVEGKFKGTGKPKMHFYAEQMVHTFEKVSETARKHDIRKIDLARYRVALSPIPLKDHAFPTPHREAADHPFYLTTYKRMYRNQAGNTAQNPILNALGSDTTENFILMNRATAGKLNIRDGGKAAIETRVGKVIGKVKLTEGIRPDTVAVSYHYGHFSAGFPAYAKKGIWINQALELHPDLVSGMNSFNDTKCKVYKA